MFEIVTLTDMKAAFDFYHRYSVAPPREEKEQEGYPTALVSLPLRYMHSPSEVCHMDDIQNSIELLARFLCTINGESDLDPFH